eukprot:5956506-Pyramimonas_sp.AAC.1
MRATLEAAGIQVDAAGSEEVVKERFQRFQTSCVEVCKRILPMTPVQDESLEAGLQLPCQRGRLQHQWQGCLG